MASSDLDLARRALADDDDALEALIRRVVPVIRARVHRVTRKTGGGMGAHDADDLVQEVWVALIADDGRTLLAYDPGRGMTLEGYVGMIAEREVGNLLQKERAKKRGGHLKPVANPAASVPASTASPEQQAVTANLATRLDEHLGRELPARGRLVLRLAFNDGRAPAEVAELMGVSLQVVYNWQHKIRSLARAFLA